VNGDSELRLQLRKGWKMEPSVKKEEIEITSEMIEAAMPVIWRPFGEVMPWGSDSARGIVVEVFQAMIQARSLQGRCYI
jgi:hypothetical protein